LAHWELVRAQASGAIQSNFKATKTNTLASYNQHPPIGLAENEQNLPFLFWPRNVLSRVQGEYVKLLGYT